jgi:DNA-binding NarL/FixJ family response regulator
MSSLKSITVLLAEDHSIVREGLRALLLSALGIEVVGEAVNGRQAVELTRKLKPLVVVMDIGMPLLNGLEATRQILKIAPAIRRIICFDCRHKTRDFSACLNLFC